MVPTWGPREDASAPWNLIRPSDGGKEPEALVPTDPMTNDLFTSDLWLPALERFGSDTRLSVKLFDDNERVVLGPIHSTPLFQLFEENGYDPGIFSGCARRCLAQTDRRPAMIVSDSYGLAAIGTSLTLDGKVVGAAVGGYAFVDFSELSEIQRLAKDAGIKLERLWEIARAQTPVPQQRLMLHGELLQVLGDALLRENRRTRQYEEALLELQETVEAKEKAHEDLRAVASALHENEKQLTKELAERKQAEAALQAGVDRLRFVMEAMPQKTFTATPSGSIDYCNHQWTEFTGLRFEQTSDWDWQQLVHPDDLDESVHTWRHSIETGEPLQLELRFRHKDGSYRWHFSQAVAMRDPYGKTLMWIGSCTDVEDQRRSAEALRKAEKLAAAGRMAATIAHEINNPLAALTNLWYLLNQEETLPSGTRERLQLLGTELNRVVNITKQTLDFYREGSTAVPIDLRDSINDAIKLLAQKAASQGATIETDYRISMPVNGYPGELRQVFSNLIINAVEAGATTIKIRMSPAVDLQRPSRRGVHVLFADNGAGIPANAKPNIFEPFVTTKADKGTGLGLWVTKGIIQKHEGWMRVLSSTNGARRGTSFCIFLPEATNRSPRELRNAA